MSPVVPPPIVFPTDARGAPVNSAVSTDTTEPMREMSPPFFPGPAPMPPSSTVTRLDSIRMSPMSLPLSAPMLPSVATLASRSVIVPVADVAPYPEPIAAAGYELRAVTVAPSIVRLAPSASTAVVGAPPQLVRSATSSPRPSGLESMILSSPPECARTGPVRMCPLRSRVALQVNARRAAGRP